ncbi:MULTISPECIES: CotY/CotZ family spore coat protein [Clostridia]|uniref:CotY/CotZ family spore coat protein n=1 Tax=Clostridia TaxID=186801 RepID=UPI000EA2AF00|nr:MULTISPECIES: CotY/CotZ family spore coat protein [Clostridia]NBJ70912.1 spore coat protein [Roseburia sp. 1XD42-34]RKI75555.1 spore coat protein [Clostridium sp. 1xD42-85]
MGCGKDFDTGNCVCDILKEIAEAQNDVIENCCDSSCEQSINDLLGETDQGNGLDTVPLILYCKGNCKPFKGFGAHPNDIGDIVASFFFRVKKVKDDCCAVLELLRDPRDDKANPHDPVEQDTKPLRATGICITVDLNCFCHVTCLPAINALN